MQQRHGLRTLSTNVKKVSGLVKNVSEVKTAQEYVVYSHNFRSTIILSCDGFKPFQAKTCELENLIYCWTHQTKPAKDN